MKKQLLLFSLILFVGWMNAAEKPIVDTAQTTNLQLNHFERKMGGNLDMVGISDIYALTFKDEPFFLDFSFSTSKDNFFKGQYALIMTLAHPIEPFLEDLSYEINDSEIIYTEQIDLKANETFSLRENISKYVWMSERKGQLCLIPAIKEDGDSEWRLFENVAPKDQTVKIGFNKSINIAATFMGHGNLDAPASVSHRETFEVIAPILHLENPDLVSNYFDIGIYRYEIPKPINHIASSLNWHLVSIINTSANGDVYTCQVPDSVIAGDYALFPILKGSPTVFNERFDYTIPNPNPSLIYRPMSSSFNQYINNLKIRVISSSGIDTDQTVSVRLNSPVTDILYIDGEVDTQHDIRIYDVKAKLVASVNATTRQINMAGLSSGIYIVRIGTQAHKVMKL